MTSLSEYPCLIVIHFTLLLRANQNVCNMPLDKSVYSKTHFFLFLIQNISGGYKKELAHKKKFLFGHPQQMLKLNDNKMWKTCFSIEKILAKVIKLCLKLNEKY